MLSGYNPFFLYAKIRLMSTKKTILFSDWLPLIFQFLFVALLFHYLVGYNDELKLLYIVLLIANVSAMLISDLFSRQLNFSASIQLNFMLALGYFLAGWYFSDLLRFEIIEQVATDLVSDPNAEVITARVVYYTGWEFFFIYILNAIPSYRQYIVLKPIEIEGEETNFSEKLFSVKTGSRIHLFPYNETEYIEASGNYINIYRKGRKYTARMGLGEFLKKANCDSIIRVHRSFAVHIDSISEIENDADGFDIILKDRRIIRGGKQYKEEVFTRLGI